jgi:hypothetical protein
LKSDRLLINLTFIMNQRNSLLDLGINIEVLTILVSSIFQIGPLNIIEPFDSLAVFPDTSPITAILSVDTLTVLLSILPPTFVLLAVIPGVNTISVLSVVLVVSIILSAILPGIKTLAVHIIIFPLTVVLSTIWPNVDSLAVDLVFKPLAFVH